MIRKLVKDYMATVKKYARFSLLSFIREYKEVLIYFLMMIGFWPKGFMLVGYYV